MKIADPRRFALVRKLATPLARVLAVVSIVQPMATGFARLDWRADLLTHFREPAMVISLVAAALMASIRRPIAVGLAILGLWQAWGLSTCSWPNPVPPGPRPSVRLRVLMANLLVDNTDQAALIDLVRLERPDVLGLVEVSTAWVAGLEPIRSEYPYRYDHPFDDDGRGLALWLKDRPISVELISALTPGGLPAFHAVIDFGGKPRHLWLVHFVSPFERPHELRQGDEFVALAERVRRDGGSALVVGDFNSTDGSPYFGRFLAASRLKDSRLGFGRRGSWPTWSPYRIGIDHAFVSVDLAVEDRRLGPEIGSDHLPLILGVVPVLSPEANETDQASQSSGLLGSSSANLTRSARRRKATSASSSVESNRSTILGSSAISSVVFDAQAGPKDPIKAVRTTSEAAISR